MKHLFLTVAFFACVGAMGQSVTTPAMILEGSGGSAIGMVTSMPVSGTGEGGSFIAPVLDVYNLPAEVATALDADDLEDVVVSVAKGKITVSAEGDFECNVYDVSGRLVAMQRASAPVGFNLAKGVFVVAVMRDGKVVCARKALVK